MVGLKIATAAALVLTMTPTHVLAQGFSEPAAFQAQHPDRDVLNGGALTPAGAGLAVPRAAYGALGAPGYPSLRTGIAKPRARHRPRS